MTKKIHLHSEQFDGALHPWCGKGDRVVGSDEFESTERKLRCFYCDREWFPNGQPGWHFQAAVRRQLAGKGEGAEKTLALVHSQNGDRACGASPRTA